MSKTRVRSLVLVAVFAAVLGIFAFPPTASATHSWGGYHWARTSNPFTLKLGNNTSGTWTNLLALISSDWSKSAVLDTTIVAGGTRPKTCRPTSGRVEVCNASYGNTGWLGVAQIWISGGVHITQGTVRNNDYYFGNSTYTYNNEAEKRHVICQEVGHTFGLGHQDESGISLNTCMDYYHNTSNSDTKSTTPNQHDYDELAIIYAHTDAFSTIGSIAFTLPGNASHIDLNERAEWGALVSTTARGDASTFVREFAHGVRMVTHVIWAE